jgi:hypothetical protein
VAQNITLLGASYSDVPAVTLPKTGGGIAQFTDVTGTTATAADVAQGKIFFAADGTQTTGTSSGGGGGYGYTLLGSTDITTSMTGTQASSAGQLTVSGAFTADKIIYVRIRDTAGKRAGYFYGSDNFFINYQKANNGTSALTYAGRLITRYSTSSVWGLYSGATTTGYGVYAYDINTSGRIRIYQRYNSNYSLTINGTYHIEVYALDWPDGVSVFD